MYFVIPCLGAGFWWKMRFCGVAVVVEGYGDKLLREVIDSKDEVWFRGPVVELINEVDFG